MVNICLCLGSYLMQDIVDLLLDVGYQVYGAHDRYLEDFLPMMDANRKNESVVRVQALLIEEQGGV